jgi:arginyl-tRNA synthetase
LLPQLLEEKASFGHAKAPTGKTMVIDFSSPNVAKPIGFHHIRSTVIGNALSNIFDAIGWKTERINYLGDWGTQFGKLIVAYKRWGNEETLRKEKIQIFLTVCPFS